jgi:hypothetical protein
MYSQEVRQVGFDWKEWDAVVVKVAPPHVRIAFGGWDASSTIERLRSV